MPTATNEELTAPVDEVEETIADLEMPAADISLVSVDLQQVDLRDAIRLICRQSQSNVVLDKSVRKKITISASNEPASQVIERIVSEHNLSTCNVGGVLLIYQMPYTSYRIYKGPENYVDKLPEAAEFFLERLEGDGVTALVDYEFSDKDINLVLKDLASQAGFEYKTACPVRINIWGSFWNVPAAQAFVAIVLGNGYSVRKEGSSWIVDKAEPFWHDKE